MSFAKTREEAIERVRIKRGLRMRGFTNFRNDESTKSLSSKFLRVAGEKSVPTSRKLSRKVVRTIG